MLRELKKIYKEIRDIIWEAAEFQLKNLRMSIGQEFLN